MPKARSLTDRETVDLHAPWWSPTQTEDGSLETPEWPKDARGEYVPGGRFVERVVVYARMLQADQDWIQAKVLSSIRVDAEQVRQIAQRGGNSALDMDMSGSEKVRTYTLRRLVVEMTDEAGVPQPLTEETFAALDSYDGNFLEGEINRLNEPPVRVTPQDERQAALNAEINAQAEQTARKRGNGRVVPLKPTDPQAVAEDNFRRRR